MDYDLFVIGAGSGGVRAARMAAGFGARVAIAEERYLGGTCVNVGCVPKKLYVYASEYGRGFEDAKGFGWQSDTPPFDWRTLRDNKSEEIRRLNSVYDRMLANVDATVLRGRARIVGPNEVELDGKRYTAGKILIATGGRPRRDTRPGAELGVTSDQIFDLPEFPRRILINGGGYIAVEFASIFNGLGAEVVQLYRGELFLRGFDRDVREFVAQELPKSGIDLRWQSIIESIERGDDGLRCRLSDDSEITVDQVLYAIGREPSTDGLGLENVGVERDERGYIVVDEDFRTAAPTIFAVGDVTGGMELTPVALAEGMAFARKQFGSIERPVEYDFIPSAVFCQPSIGTVGFTEEQARAEFGAVTIYKTSFRPMKHTITGRDEKTLMKLIVDDASDRVVGVHMVGPEAGEIVQGIAIALKAGATKATFDATIGIHPTAAEEFVTMREPSKG
ncbi:MAG: glutathione-disulfide reductase [Planctomycetes bacterium]|nr:glutathione-disulfide reductase [Planctomycetota bacterium]